MNAEGVSISHYEDVPATGAIDFGVCPVDLTGMQDLRPKVRGQELDAQTRCAHYRSALDVIAIKMKCCGIYYACKDCHNALADHPIEVWPLAEWNEPAVLCGICGYEMTVEQYLASSAKCPECAAPFNPNCSKHYGFYFETEA